MNISEIATLLAVKEDSLQTNLPVWGSTHIEKLIDDGLVTKDEKNYQVTEKGEKMIDIVGISGKYASAQNKVITELESAAEKAKNGFNKFLKELEIK